MDPNFTPEVTQGAVVAFDEWIKYNEYLQRQANSSQTLHTDNVVQAVVPETQPNPRKKRYRKGGALKKPNPKLLHLRVERRLTCGTLPKKSLWQELGLAKARIRQMVMINRGPSFWKGRYTQIL